MKEINNGSNGTVDKCLGFGGIGDCFIVMLKLLELKKPYIYTHIDVSENRLSSSIELLNKTKNERVNIITMLIIIIWKRFI